MINTGPLRIDKRYMCREHSPKCARKAENNIILQDHPEPIYLPCKVETIHTNVLDAKS